jgi:hypothetical protein
LASELVTQSTEEENKTIASMATDKSLKGFILQQEANQYEITQNEILPAEGKIFFEADVKNESSTDSGVVARVQFLPVKETNKSSVSFSFTGEDGEPTPTYLYDNGDDQLGSAFNPVDGYINFDFSVVSSYEEARNQRTVVKSQNNRFSESGEELDTFISLIPRQKQVDVGDEVEVDVYIANPNEEAIDSVNLLIAYNPRVFEPIDADEYEPGINIDDKKYMDDFPFDFPLVNTIDADRGIIDYRKRVNRSPVRGEGILATIRLKALRPTTKTTLRIFLNENGEVPTTGIFYRNVDRLGDPSDPFDGVKTSSIKIRPTVAYLKRIQEKGM